MFAPAATPDANKTPLCPTCVEPMALVRIIKQTSEAELRIFTCEHCRVLMFTEIP